MILNINQQNPQTRLIKQIAECLKLGGIVAYPTDTFYGIGCDIMNKKAIQKVYAITKQDFKKPLSFICSDLKNISQYAEVSNLAYRIMKRVLPGPYTFILEASRLVPKIMLTKRRCVGIRIPDNKICIDLVRALGNPIISTSLTDLEGNKMFEPQAIKKYFHSNIDIIIEGNIVPNQPSTIISLLRDEPEIIREGLGDISIF